MQKQQVFKVKGMQRDLSMANTNGEFAYEIVNMRLMPTEENAGLSLTNEKGTLQISNQELQGTILGQCETPNGIVVFTYNGSSIIYYIQNITDTSCSISRLYIGDLGFSADHKIEALFNYETEDIQKVYWVDGINQLRCINIAPTRLEEIEGLGNNTQFDAVKEITQLPTVLIERVSGGQFTAGVLQYHITYYNEFSSESAIIYSSPLLYLAHENRGANVNDLVSTAFKLNLTNLDTTNWNYIRIYATHRTSIDATPEGSIVAEIRLPESGTVEFVDFGNNRTAIAATDLYFKGGKFVKVGTMTVKDQVMFLGNLSLFNYSQDLYTKVKEFFEGMSFDKMFSTKTRKQIDNNLEEYQDTYYTHKFTLNNTDSITHYKYGEKYRFGISVMDNYGNWSNPIWLLDSIIQSAPEQINGDTLELPCPSLNLNATFSGDATKTLWEILQEFGVVAIKPLVVFPNEEERKVIAQGVVCPTVYNLKDRKENGPYAQASWFMRPNAPIDLWGTSFSNIRKGHFDMPQEGQLASYKDTAGYLGAATLDKLSNGLTGYDYMYDDYSPYYEDDSNTLVFDSKVQFFTKNSSGKIETEVQTISQVQQQRTYEKGNWVEFRHNYALRSKGWSFGTPTIGNTWSHSFFDEETGVNKGMVRVAELDVSRADVIPPTNNFHLKEGEPDSGYKIPETIPLNHIIFATLLSPKEFHKAQRNGECPAVYVFYRRKDVDTIYLKEVQTIILPEDKKFDVQNNYSKYYTWYSAPYDYIQIPDFILKNEVYTIATEFLRLKCKRKAANEQLMTNGASYYIWDVGDFSTITKEEYMSGYMPEISGTQVLPILFEKLYYGDVVSDNLSLGNASYYVDSSIVTLNSPEVELQDKNFNLEDVDFRVVGMIPLTATSSDISLEVDDPTTDYYSNNVGLFKRTYKNTNIGYHGFKGMVGSNAYLSSLTTDPSKPSDQYSLVQLSPWQSAGTLGLYPNDSDYFKTKDLLKKKILSNLRYSASTYYINAPWEPYEGSYSQVFRGETAEDIIKLEDLKYTTKSLVYKGNIDTIANLTKGDTNTPFENPIYSFGYSPISKTGEVNINAKINSPAASIYKDTEENPDIKYVKTSQGASIRYKSSPHFVVGFKCLNPIGDAKQKIQETLPAWVNLNQEGVSTDYELISSWDTSGHLYEDAAISSAYHQSNISPIINTEQFTGEIFSLFREQGVFSCPNYGWLWLGELYRKTDPSFGGTSDYALQNNQWNIAGMACTNVAQDTIKNLYKVSSQEEISLEIGTAHLSVLNNSLKRNDIIKAYITDCTILRTEGSVTHEVDLAISLTANDGSKHYLNVTGSLDSPIDITMDEIPDVITKTISYDLGPFETKPYYISQQGNFILRELKESDKTITCDVQIILPITGSFTLSNMKCEVLNTIKPVYLDWTIGDTYYQRFDTLKTYAYDTTAQNSIVDITSFMVETRINIDGRTDRNRGQESNLQMSPTNFNLINDIYSQKDNFFTYRILDDDVQSRVKFPNQITWSLSKTAGETIDSWMNITLASVLDLDGAEGELKALKTFNNSIIAFQESGISQILFNSRVQIPTSEMVPIQIANSGKVDGQQFISRDVGCQDKWNIVTTTMGLYFIDYFNKSIYRFNGKLEDLSSSKGFRGWCDKYINSNSSIIGYYDVKNKEIMYYDSNFRTNFLTGAVWLGFSELTDVFSSFYSYPEAILTKFKSNPLWLYDSHVYRHNAGDYNRLLDSNDSYGITVIARQDSNTVKTFNNIEFRADTYSKEGTLLNTDTFNTLEIWTENDGKTRSYLSYEPYRPSNLKKMLRTWRANIPRVDNKYKRYVNQWAKISLWETKPTTEKTILHDLAVIYSE